MNTPTTTPAPVTATEVADALRLDFLPFYFGARFMAIGEGMVYERMGSLCAQYKGASWKFYSLSNGGFYMAPSLPGPMDLAWHENHSSATVQPDAAGIIATLFVLSNLACALHDRPGNFGDHFTEAFHNLRDFAKDHAEAQAIFRIID